MSAEIGIVVKRFRRDISGPNNGQQYAADINDRLCRAHGVIGLTTIRGPGAWTYTFLAPPSVASQYEEELRDLGAQEVIMTEEQVREYLLSKGLPF